MPFASSSGGSSVPALAEALYQHPSTFQRKFLGFQRKFLGKELATLAEILSWCITLGLLQEWSQLWGGTAAAWRPPLVRASRAAWTLEPVSTLCLRSLPPLRTKPTSAETARHRRVTARQYRSIMLHGQLTDGGRSWADVEFSGIRLQGRLAPRLILGLVLSTPAAGITTTLTVVRVDLLWNDELLGSGNIVDERLNHFDQHRSIELPSSRRLVQEVTDRLGTGATVVFRVRFEGAATVVIRPDAQDIPRMVGDPEAGQPFSVHFNTNNDFQYAVPRTTWYEQVVARLGDSDYLALDVLIPRGATGEPWRQTMNHVASARRSYTNGDDSVVFHHLRAAFDALPGAKQNIFDLLPEPKRGEVDKLVGAVSHFLHAGRHVTKVDGTFPVDHIDAGLALNLMDVLLSYVSRAVEAAQNRA